MTILTEEMIIKAAIAIVDRRFDVISGRVPTEYEVGKLYATAALEAIVPDVVEKCAQVCDGERIGLRYRTWSYMTGNRSDECTEARHSDALAASIRSLIPQEGK